MPLASPPSMSAIWASHNAALLSVVGLVIGKAWSDFDGWKLNVAQNLMVVARLQGQASRFAICAAVFGCALLKVSIPLLLRVK